MQQSGGLKIGLPLLVRFDWTLRRRWPCLLKSLALVPKLRQLAPTSFAGYISREFVTLSITACEASFLKLWLFGTQVAKIARQFDTMTPNTSFQRTPQKWAMGSGLSLSHFLTLMQPLHAPSSVYSPSCNAHRNARQSLPLYVARTSTPAQINRVSIDCSFIGVHRRRLFFQPWQDVIMKDLTPAPVWSASMRASAVARVGTMC